MTTKFIFLRCAVMVISLLFLQEAAFGHHGNTDYDSTKDITLKGTIAAFEFINPHAEILLDVKNNQGKVERWSLELSSPNSLRRNGWNRNTLKPGMEVIAVVNPNRNGSKNTYLQKLTFSDGKEIRSGGQ